MTSLRPLLALYLITTMLVFNACEMTPSEECLQEIITDPSYFSVDRVLSNNCTKAQGIDYILTGNNTYIISANTFIEAGTIIEIEDSAALLIETTGTLQASGTATAPIIIRGHYKSSGNWRGLFVRSSSALNQLHQVQLEDAGGASMTGETARGAVVLLDQGKIAINHSKITRSASYGVNITSLTAHLSELNNSIVTNTQVPVRLHTTQAGNIAATNTFAGNQKNYVEFCIVPFVNQVYTWPNINTPYHLMPMDSSSPSIQSLAGTANLNIESGTIIEMTTGTGFSVRDLGKFSAIGTAEAPIIFTGAIKGYSTWEGFEFRFTQQDNRLEHTIIEHSGNQGGIIYMWGDPKVTLDEVEMTYSSSCAFYDAPKTSSQSINSNLFFRNVIYSFVNAQYCKGS